MDHHILEIGENFFKRLYGLIARRHWKVDFPGATETVEAMLFITLRIKAGASYLDVGWPYGVATPTVYKIFNKIWKP